MKLHRHSDRHLTNPRKLMGGEIVSGGAWSGVRKRYYTPVPCHAPLDRIVHNLLEFGGRPEHVFDCETVEEVLPDC